MTLKNIELSAERLLLIDDEKAILHTFGYKVTSHNRSADALKCFKKSPYEFDLVITDMTMPEPSGNKLVSEIKNLRPEIPVILCTGLSKKIASCRVSAVKPDKILMKPAGKDELLKSIRYLLDN